MFKSWGIVLTAALLLHSQAGPAPEPAFEVASIKPSRSSGGSGPSGGPGSSDPGRYTYPGATLEDLIVTAYHVDYFQISSHVPLDRQPFDLVAKVPPAATLEQFRAMLRNLLAERFHLRTHTETRDFPGYELQIAREGFKLKEAAASDHPEMRSTHTASGAYFLVKLTARHQPMSMFAQWLNPPDGQPVVDRTGLHGRYDFTLEYTYEMGNAAADAGLPPPVAPDLFTALRRQLGLQLVRKKVPFPVVVVDSTDLRPIQN